MDETEDSAGRGNWRPWFCWILVGAMLIWAVSRSFGLERGYPSFQIMAYTPYVLVLSLLALLVVVLLRQWIPFLLGAVAVAALAIAVVPREFGGPDQPTGGEAVRILSFNTLRGRADIDQLLDVVEARDVEVLSLQETSPSTARSLKQGGLGKLLPFSAFEGEGDAGGGILSRHPLSRIPPGPSILGQPRAVVRRPGSVPFEVMSVHPVAPSGPKSTPVFSREFDRLPPGGDPGPARILAGDFNSTLDHRKLRDLIGTGYRDAGDSMGLGLVSTWPSTLKWPLPVTLDHFLVEDPIAIVGYDVEAIDGSDHRAVYAELVVPDS